ncbi:hypothetical protein [Cereibacter johrii]|uniref:hypothetical protein n=1 Tax=Cereibacter johrii TaxID=445629 RepID=UPI000DCD04B2|nr:hypothetical protein [Cereibacter johrii]RAZ83417.1 hypothetical protein DDV93_13990 [Cereibacter johrii]
MKFPLLLAVAAFSASSAYPESIKTYELKRDTAGYPCFLETTTDKGHRLTIQLSDHKDVWSLHFWVSGRPDIYRRYFDRNGMRDQDAIEKAYTEIKIGEHTFKIHETSFFYALRQSEVDEKTSLGLELKEKHHVAGALGSMDYDWFAIPGLITATNTSQAFSEFRQCSYDAMGLKPGERVEMDMRAEYRMIFEKSFKNWIASASTAESCLVSRVKKEDIEAVIDRAVSAFYPGIMNFMKRREYAEELNSTIALAQLGGSVDAMKKGGCMMAGQLAEMSKMPVEKAIESAEDVE